MSPLSLSLSPRLKTSYTLHKHSTHNNNSSRMSVALESLSLTNPNPISGSPLKKRGSMALCPSLRFEYLLRPRSCRVSIIASTVSPKGLGSRFLSLDRRSSWNPSIVSYAASHEESKHSEIEVEKEKNDLEVEAQESQEEWERTLASFKEQALKMQSVSEEAYELYSKKAMVILKKTSEQLKIQADKAGHDLTLIAKEISEEGKEYLSRAAENSPEPVKEIVETFASSTDNLNEIAKVRDFYLGIPYGALLSVGGFLSFMLTGSISAIRFGVILGGALLALSISSLRSWKRGASFALALKGQAAIAGVIFIRQMYLLSQQPLSSSCFTTLISAAMVAFYLYRITLDGGEQTKGSNLEHGTKN